MKILYNPKKAEKRKRKAIKGCDKCPICGEIRHENVIDGEYVGIYYRTVSTISQGVYEKRLYYCNTCTAQWESKKYRVD